MPDQDVAITWLGHAAFSVLTPKGKTIILDPWLENNPSCPPNLRRPSKCDLLLLTHGHSDHIANAVTLAARTGAHTVGIAELITWLGRQGLRNATAMNKGGTVRFGDIAVTMVHAIHSSSVQVGERSEYAGEAAGFVVRLENGFTFYHAGDTCVFGDMAMIAELYEPDLAMLPIGDHFTMSPKEAAMAIRLLGVHQVIPMHLKTFPQLSGSVEALQEATRGIDGLKIHLMQPGDTLHASA